MVFVLVIWYLWYQHLAKLGTLDKFKHYHALIRAEGAEFKILAKQFHPKRNLGFLKFLRSDRIPGILIMLISCVFYASELTVIFAVSN